MQAMRLLLKISDWVSHDFITPVALFAFCAQSYKFGSWLDLQHDVVTSDTRHRLLNFGPKLGQLLQKLSSIGKLCTTINNFL